MHIASFYRNASLRSLSGQSGQWIIVVVLSLCRIIGKHTGRIVIKTRYAVTLSMVAGAAIGAAAIQSLHAQAKPMAYVVAAPVINDQAAYAKEFAPVITKEVEAAGGKYLARGGKTISIHGVPPAPRVVIVQFESVDKAQAWANAPATKAAFAIGEKYSTIRDYIVEGVAQ
jgi:uncharacterized protein (DUF1330 family)